VRDKNLENEANNTMDWNQAEFEAAELERYIAALRVRCGLSAGRSGAYAGRAFKPFRTSW
jgi:hypothetical protein